MGGDSEMATQFSDLQSPSSCLSVVNHILDDIKRVVRSLQQVRFVAVNMQDSAGPNQDSKPSYISQEKLIYIG
jgi:hypothetical protein